MNILEELYYGNIDPAASFKCDKKLLDLMCKNAEKLTEDLTNKQNELFDKYSESCNEMYCQTIKEAFIQGFSIGARIIIEVMNKNPLVDYLD